MLGNYITTADTMLFAIGIGVKNLITILSRIDYCYAEIAIESQARLTAI